MLIFRKTIKSSSPKAVIFCSSKSNNFQSSIIRNAGPPPKFTPTVNGPVTKIISIIEFLEVCHITTKKLLSCFKHKKLELYEYLAWWVNPSLEKSAWVSVHSPVQCKVGKEFSQLGNTTFMGASKCKNDSVASSYTSSQIRNVQILACYLILGLFT